MNEIHQQAIRKYSRVRPEDLHRARVYAAKATIDAIIEELQLWSNNFPDPEPSTPMTIFGLPLRIDDSIPFGIWDFMIEIE